MNGVLELFALFLMANLLAGAARLLIGPSPADRLLTAQLFGSVGVALLLVLATRGGMPALRHIALVFVLLALLATVVFTRGSPDGTGDGTQDSRR